MSVDTVCSFALLWEIPFKEIADSKNQNIHYQDFFILNLHSFLMRKLVILKNWC